jgi:rhamnosyltransferase subunit B
MQVLIPCLGTHGDVLPYLALAQALKARGHTPVLYANPHFGHTIDATGIEFRAISSAATYQSLFGATAQTDPMKALKQVAQHYAQTCPDYYRALQADIVPGDTVVLAGVLLFAARLLRELDHGPWVAAHIAPCTLRSNLQPSRLGPRWVDTDTAAWVKRLTWWVSDTLVYDPLFTKPFNTLRKQYGLAPLKRPFQDWADHADRTIGLFPDWFAPPQADWPAGMVPVGFPTAAPVSNPPALEPHLEEFLALPAPAVLFTPGTANGNAAAFFETSVQACVRLGIKGVLVSGFEAHIPRNLPPTVLHIPFVPFASVLHRVNAVVHHGGIGTSSQALWDGVPQLIRPTAYDQFDNAARLQRLGVARELLPQHYTVDAVSNTLRELLASDTTKSALAQCQARMRQGHAMDMACKIIEYAAR